MSRSKPRWDQPGAVIRLDQNGVLVASAVEQPLVKRRRTAEAKNVLTVN